MKRKITVLFLLLAVMLLTMPAAAIDLEPGTGDAFYVQDNANVLSAATEAQIVTYNETLETQCDNAQIVVVTVNYLDEDSDVAATQLMNDWGVGSAENSNGMLLLLVAREYRGWLATGDGIDDVFTDNTADEYLNKYFWDYIDADKYDEGVFSLCSALYEWYLDYYGVSNTNEYTSAKPAGASTVYSQNNEYYEPPHYSSRRSGPSGFLILLILIILLWCLTASNHYRRMRGWGYTGSFWPLFWFGGPRLYRSWHRRYPGPRPPHGAPGPRPPYGAPGPRPPHDSPGPGSFHRTGGFGGYSSGGGAGRSRSSGAGRSGGGSRGGGGGGRSGGGGGGRR